MRSRADMPQEPAAVTGAGVVLGSWLYSVDSPLRPLPCWRSTRPPSSSGLGRRPFKAEARVRIPLGARFRARPSRSCRGAMTTQQHERAPVEESGRPHLPVKEEIAGSKPVGRAIRTPSRPLGRRGVVRDDYMRRSHRFAARTISQDAAIAFRALQPVVRELAIDCLIPPTSILSSFYTGGAWRHRAPSAP